jgi:hypothetical protein
MEAWEENPTRIDGTLRFEVVKKVNLCEMITPNGSAWLMQL